MHLIQCQRAKACVSQLRGHDYVNTSFLKIPITLIHFSPCTHHLGVCKKKLILCVLFIDLKCKKKKKFCQPS